MSAVAVDTSNEKNAEYEKMFLDKLTLLNRTFLKVIENCVRDMPDADLSPTVKDYLKHVNSLDEMYGGNSLEKKTRKRPIKIAKRSKKLHRNSGGETLNVKDCGKTSTATHVSVPASAALSTSVATSSPAAKSQLAISTTNDAAASGIANKNESQTSQKVSVFGNFSTTQKSTSASTVASTPKFDFGSGNTSTGFTKTNNDGNGPRGRKRANRGGQDGRDDFVIISPKRAVEKSDIEGSKKADQFSTNSVTKDSPSAEAPEKQSTKASFLFPSKTVVSLPNTLATGKLTPVFSFGTAANKKATENNDNATATNSTEDKNEKTDCATKITSPLSLNNSGSSATSSTPFVFGKTSATNKTTDITTSPANKAPLFNIGKSTDNEQSSEKLKLSFPTTGSVFKTASKTSSELVFSFNASKVGSSDISAVKPLAPGSLSGFKFGVTGSSASTSTKSEDKEEEYVPPKPEAVLQEEPNAILSTKCSVFVLKGKEYEKIGIGQLHIKKDGDDGEKKIILIRAATTIGTVWVNSYVDKNTKVSKADETKLRVSCVNETTPNTYLIRFPNAKVREQVEEQLKV